MNFICKCRLGKGQRASVPELYWQHIDEFKSIFDAVAIGQFLGGLTHRTLIK
jgi:hypothetical protein